MVFLLVCSYHLNSALPPDSHFPESKSPDFSRGVRQQAPSSRKGEVGAEMQLPSPSPAPPCGESHPSFQKQASCPPGGFCGGNQAGALLSQPRLVTEPPPTCQLLISLIASFQSCAAVVCSPVLSLLLSNSISWFSPPPRLDPWILPAITESHQCPVGSPVSPLKPSSCSLKT